MRLRHNSRTTQTVHLHDLYKTDSHWKKVVRFLKVWFLRKAPKQEKQFLYKFYVTFYLFNIEMIFFSFLSTVKERNIDWHTRLHSFTKCQTKVSFMSVSIHCRLLLTLFITSTSSFQKKTQPRIKNKTFNLF